MEFDSEREAKRRLTSKTAVMRLLEQAENPESKKSKTGGPVAVINGCMCGV